MSDWRDLPVVNTKPDDWRKLPTTDNLGDADSPMRKAIAEAPPDQQQFTVDTPTGPASFDRQGNRIFSSDETKTQGDAMESRFGQEVRSRAIPFLNGASLGLAPYMAGAAGAVRRQLNPLTKEGLIESFRKSTDEARDTVDETTKHAGVGWDLAGRSVPAVATGPASLVGRTLLNAGLGAVEGFTGSKAKLNEEGGINQAARDAGFGAGVGGLASVGGEMVSWPLRALGRRLGSAATKNAEKVVQQETENLTSAATSKASEASRLSAELKRQITEADYVIQNPELFEPQVVEAMKSFRRLPEVLAERSRMAQGAVNGFNSTLNAFREAQKEASTAATGIADKAADAAAQRLNPLNAATELTGGASRSIGQRALLQATGITSQGPLQFLRNTVKNPAYASITQGAFANTSNAAASGIENMSRLGGREGANAINGYLSPPATPRQYSPTKDDERAIAAFLDAP